MRTNKFVVAFLLIATVFVLTACQAKKTTQQPTTPANQQSAAELPTVQMQPVKIDDPSTFPKENYIAVAGTDGQKNGDAYRTYLLNKFIIKIAVTLPNLGSGEQYTAFLVNAGSHKFLPLGNLNSKGGKWIVDFSSDRDGREFAHLEIVSGKNIIDPDKGKLVAAGDFPN
ncbi:MAG: hypothetical protein V1846_02250 [Candidatus Komeilibacteria bacterium]